ncbi:MAG: hypothetical protein NZ777_09255, partial [Pseudomonadales bacterium]|nr:hypothetical protein [Pseudomonadales bacterium]
LLSGGLFGLKEPVLVCRGRAALQGKRSAVRTGADGDTLAGRSGIERNEEDIGMQLKNQALKIAMDP